MLMTRARRMDVRMQPKPGGTGGHFTLLILVGASDIMVQTMEISFIIPEAHLRRGKATALAFVVPSLELRVFRASSLACKGSWLCFVLASVCSLLRVSEIKIGRHQCAGQSFFFQPRFSGDLMYELSIVLGAS